MIWLERFRTPGIGREWRGDHSRKLNKDPHSILGCDLQSEMLAKGPEAQRRSLRTSNGDTSANIQLSRQDIQPAIKPKR